MKARIATHRRQRGVMSMEMGLILPFVILLLLGMVDLSRMHLAGRKAVTAAQSAADLIAQETTIDTPRMDDIARAITTILEPFPAAAVGFDLISVEMDMEGNLSIGWRYSGGAIEVAESFPPGVMGLPEPGGSVIASVVSYQHAPLFGLFDPMTFSEVGIAKPRRVSTIPRLDEPG
ncbi:MAG: pilus assembly protein [Gammaproteobacteria bacterium]|nr:pilus assembly protein [Gammaproteobacteria bacterium]